MSDPVWPLHGIRVRGTGLDLRVMVEADLLTVRAPLPDDLDGVGAALPLFGMEAGR
ncbi:hypothetical protein GCM10027053_19530 [Intrasporangium mesophilum]